MTVSAVEAPHKYSYSDQLLASVLLGCFLATFTLAFAFCFWQFHAQLTKDRGQACAFRGFHRPCSDLVIFYCDLGLFHGDRKLFVRG